MQGRRTERTGTKSRLCCRYSPLAGDILAGNPILSGPAAGAAAAAAASAGNGTTGGAAAAASVAPMDVDAPDAVAGGPEAV